MVRSSKGINAEPKKKEKSLKEKIYTYFMEVAEVSGPGMIIMNGGYYRPAK